MARQRSEIEPGCPGCNARQETNQIASIVPPVSVCAHCHNEFVRPNGDTTCAEEPLPGPESLGFGWRAARVSMAYGPAAPMDRDLLSPPRLGVCNRS